jgi:hypothetical protein
MGLPSKIQSCYNMLTKIKTQFVVLTMKIRLVVRTEKSHKLFSK